MNKPLGKFALLFYSALTVALLVSCAETTVKPEETISASQATPAVETEPVTKTETTDLKTVNFGFNKADLSADAKTLLKDDIEWLQQNKTVSVEVEGNCDERGTEEYNRVLGERRAASVRKFLGKHGIEQSRISIVSHGKENPVAEGHDEAAWAKNRRAAIRVRSR